MERSKALDVIRGIAILMILIYHYLPRGSGTPEFLVFSTRMFWGGVDLFFVLSGFLIAGILLDNVQASNYFSTFYIRRGARILPLYLALLLVFGIVLYYHPQIIRISYKKHLPFWSYLTFTQNFLYATRGFDDPWMDVTWSLAIEEQFYIFLSVLVRNISRRHLTILSIVLIVLAPLLRLISTHMQAYILPLQRADSLMLGVLLAVIWRNEKWRGWLIKKVDVFRAALVVFLVGMLYLTFVKVPVGEAIPHLWLAFLSGTLLILALTSSSIRSGAIFENKVLEWLGLRSYGLYLLHKPVLIVSTALLRLGLGFGLDRWGRLLIEAIILVCLAELSYRLLEKPIMEFGHRFKYLHPAPHAQAAVGGES